MLDYTVLGSFVGYLLIVLWIGFFFSKRQSNLGDYYLGGRKMNKWVVALSAQASDMSGWLLMGLPGAIYVGGFSEAWIGFGLLIGTYLNWKIVAQRLRKQGSLIFQVRQPAGQSSVSLTGFLLQCCILGPRLVGHLLGAGEQFTGVGRTEQCITQADL